MRGYLALAALGSFILTQLIPLNADEPTSVNITKSSGPPDTSNADSPASKSAMLKLASIILPSVNFDKTDIPAVLNSLAIESKHLDPAHEGVRFHLNLPSGPASKRPTYWREVTITLNDAPLDEVLGFICAQTRLSYKLVKGIVVLTPVNTGQEQQDREAFVQQKLSTIIIRDVAFQKSDIGDVIDFLNHKSNELDHDRNIVTFSMDLESGNPNYSRQYTRELTILRHAVSMKELLSLITKQTQLTYIIEGSDVRITPKPLH